MKRIIILASAVMFAAGGAFAFGIEPGENNLGSEHEKITRAALRDLEPLTLKQLAGEGEFPGAVGAPDDPDRDLLGHAPAHCDGGDYLEQEGGYGQTREQAGAALGACRDFISSSIEKAVEHARGLLKASPEDVALDCDFNEQGGSAKCRVLSHLGLAFHASQDFYAHTNWVDRPRSGAETSLNPPGLGQSGRAPWLDLRLQEKLPEGLISGCPGDLHLMGVTIGCEYGALPPLVGKIRVLRKDLSKSTGPIGRGAGGIGTTPRGAINGNFSRAVRAAVEDTADKWAYFRERVMATYGRTKGATIICMLQRDGYDPKACEQRAVSEKVCSNRELAAELPADEDVYTPGLTPSEEERAGAQTRFEALAKYCVIEETDVTRAFVINGSTSQDGKAAASKAAVDQLAYWGACPAELGRKLPALSQAARDAYKAELALPKPDPKKEMSLLTRLFATCVLDAHQRQSGK